MMMAAMLLLPIAPTTQGHATVRLLPKAVLASRVLKLGDIADLSALPAALRDHASRLELAHMQDRKTPLTLALAPLLSRARAQMPLLAHWLPRTFPATITLALSQSATNLRPASRAMCLKADVAMPAGTFPTAGNFTSVDCPQKSSLSALVYDASRRAVRTGRSISAGDIISRYPQAAGHAVKPGDRMLLVTGARPVRVERRVEALQQAQEGQHLFVKTDDGEILSIAFHEGIQ